LADDTVCIEVPKASYTLANRKRDGLPEVLVVNEALLIFPHIEIFPWHLRVELRAQDLADQGMPTSQESLLLRDIADRIEAAVLEGRTEHGGENALFLARTTWNGLRELHFQVHDPELADHALRNLLEASEWQRSWEYRMEHDPEWVAAHFTYQLFIRPSGADA
jgi:hypothetical protein